MIFKTEFRIEGLSPDGDWHMIDRPLVTEGDHRAHRDHVVQTLRDMHITRYSRVRLAKYFTTIEIMGEDISV